MQVSSSFERDPSRNGRVVRAFGRAGALLALGLLAAYQALVRPFLLGSCKFFPSCSHYAADAIAFHGPLRGAWLVLRRLVRCHPFSPGGIDLVPPADACKCPSLRHV